jgi:hypothetical protein
MQKNEAGIDAPGCAAITRHAFSANRGERSAEKDNPAV